MSTRQNTKEALIRAAERLFAERGLGGVTVKDITQSAGAKNPSAVHYHFGNLESLIREVFTQRFEQISKVQIARIEAVDVKDKKKLLVAVLEAANAPFMEACLDEGGRLYVRFCYQLTTNPRFDVGKTIADIGMLSVTKLRDVVVTCLQDVPNDILAVRMRQGFAISIMQAADYANQVEAGTALPIDRAVHEAAVCQAGYLSAK
ncbi:MAG: TetR/AcrR family transcriptional regulator [Alphaproteobacteria bacterium]